MTPEDLDLVRQVAREEILGVLNPQPGAVLAVETPERRAEREAVEAAEAEAARWAAMSPAELAAEESQARIQRWRAAEDDLKARGQPVDLADLEAGMTPDEIRDAKRR